MARLRHAGPPARRGHGSRFRWARSLAAVCCAASLAPAAVVGAPTVADAAAIMSTADQAGRARYELVTMRMEVRGDGAALVREFSSRSLEEGGGRATLIRFTSPASLRGVGTLVVEDAGRANAIWHYVPATRSARRVSGEHRQNRFMGTEFTFEDFEGIKRDAYAFVVLGEEACLGSSRCFVIEARPVDVDETAGSGYARKVYRIDQRTHVIARVDLYDRDGVLVKIFESSDFRNLGGHWRPKRQVMTHVRTGHATVLTELERVLDVPFERQSVSPQALRSPP
jgi:hypothetical protein